MLEFAISLLKSALDLYSFDDTEQYYKDKIPELSVAIEILQKEGEK